MISCKSEWQYTSDCTDFDCGYGSSIDCDHCICNNGKLDPRTDKYYTTLDKFKDWIIQFFLRIRKIKGN